MPHVYGFYARTDDDKSRLLILSGCNLTTQQLLKEQWHDEFNFIDLALGANHDSIVANITAIEGVESVEMVNPKEEGSESDPVNGSCIVTRDGGTNWDVIMPQIRHVIANIARCADEEVEFSPFVAKH